MEVLGPNWRQIPALPSRHAGSLAFDSSSGQLLLFGGVGSSYLSDTWMLTPSSAPTVTLNRYVNLSDSSVHWATSNPSQPPSGFTEEGALGGLLPNPRSRSTCSLQLHGWGRWKLPLN